MQAIRCGTFLHRSYNWTKGKSKNRWFLAAFFSIFLSLLKEIWPPEANAGRGCSPQSENGKRAVGDAGPYGVRDRRHGEIRVGVGIVAAGGHAGRGSGSGDRSAGDPVRNLFAPQLQLDEREIQKPMVFGGVLFHISFAVERNMATGGKCRTRVQPAIGERKTGRRGRRPLRGARPETWRDTCGRGVPIGGGQTRNAGTGGVFRRTVIEWRRKPQNQHRRALR